MIPAVLLRFLPHIAIALAIISGVWYIDHKGYQRAKHDAERRQLVDAIANERKVRRIEKALSETTGELDAALGRKLDKINTLGAATLATLQKGINNDPRYRDPACALGDGVWRTLNEARARTGPGTDTGKAARSVTIELPAAAPAR